MNLDLDTIAHIIFGLGGILFLYKVKTRTQIPLLKLLSLNPKENLGSVKLSKSELLLVTIVFIVPLLLLAISNGFI